VYQFAPEIEPGISMRRARFPWQKRIGKYHPDELPVQRIASSFMYLLARQLIVSSWMGRLLRSLVPSIHRRLKLAYISYVRTGCGYLKEPQPDN